MMKLLLHPIHPGHDVVLLDDDDGVDEQVTASPPDEYYQQGEPYENQQFSS